MYTYMYEHVHVVCNYMCMHVCVCRYKNVWECIDVHVYGYASICAWLSACVHECVFMSVSVQVH